MIRVLRHSIIILTVILFAGAASLISCGDSKPIKLLKNVVPVAVVHPPSLTPLLRQATVLFSESPLATLAEGSEIEINLIADPTLAASDKISKGKAKVHGWIAPSTSLVNYTNIRTTNLGPQQTDCTQLFATPVVLATTSKNLPSLNADGNEFSWNTLFPMNQDGSPINPMPEFNQTSPLSSDSGLAVLIQLFYVATEFPGAAARESIEVPVVINKLRAMQTGISSYSYFDKTLLHRLIRNKGGQIKFSLTTEQEVALFNKELIQRGQEPIVALYPKEGTTWLDYNLCMSNADWLTPAHKKALQNFSEYLRQIPPQQLAVGAGLRPSVGSVPLAPPLTSKFKVDIAKGTNPTLPVSGEILSRLIDLWPNLLKPSAVAFILDTSGSMEGTSLRLGKTQFRNTIASTNERDKKALLTSSTKVNLVAEFQNIGGEIIPLLDQVKAQGGSSIYDALAKATSLIQDKNLDQYRRTIILFTDGGDKNSDTPLPRLLNIMRDTFDKININLIIVAVGKDEDFTDLKTIAENTNGLFIEASYDDLNDIFAKIRSIL
jgi:Ca-activated chloride channel family protein